MLLQDLQTLASDAEDLINAFHPSLPAADEAALIFDDHLVYAERLVAEGLITGEMLERIRAVDQLLGEMSYRHDESLWASEALREREEWEGVRRLARETLAALGYELEPPPPWEKTTKVVGAWAAGRTATKTTRRKTGGDSHG